MVFIFQKIGITTSIAVLFPLLLFSQDSDYKKGEVVVMFKEGTIAIPFYTDDAEIEKVYISSQKLASMLREIGIRRFSRVFRGSAEMLKEKRLPTGEIISFTPELKNCYVVFFNPEIEVKSVVEKLNSIREEIVFAEPNYICNLHHFPNDLHRDQWFLWQPSRIDMQAPEAWDISTGSETKLLGVIDDGVDYNHLDLGGPGFPNRKIVDANRDPISDPKWHGTSVVGIIGALTHNGFGVAGVAGGWNSSGSKIVFYKTDLSWADIANGIYWLVGKGVWAINMSLGDSTESQVARTAVAEAWKNGVVCITSMGNENTGAPQYPAGYEYATIGVGAIDTAGNRCYFPRGDPCNPSFKWGSNWGPHLDVAAGGTCFYTVAPIANGSFWYFGGTSAAAPFVTGLVGLIADFIGPVGRTSEKMEGIVRASGIFYPGWDGNSQGHGWIQARKVLDLLRDPWNRVYIFQAGGGERWLNEDFLIGAAGYFYKRTKVFKRVNYPTGRFLVNPIVWGERGNSVGTIPWPGTVSQMYYRYTGVNPGSISGTGCELITYVWRIYDVQGRFIGWWPYHPTDWNLIFNYSILVPVRPPTPPRNLALYTIECGAKFVGSRLSWSPPWDQGTMPLIGYVIQRRNLPNPLWYEVDRTNQLVYEHCPWGSCPTDYRVIAYSNAGASGESNIVTRGCPPPGDPLVSHSTDSLATAFPNGQKIVVDRCGILHTVFTSGDTVYYAKSEDRNKTWSKPITIGIGKHPAISLDKDNLPNVCWINGTNVLSSRFKDVWKTRVIYSQPILTSLEPPSFVMKGDSGFVSWTDVFPDSSNLQLASFIPSDTVSPVIVSTIDRSITPAFASPSLTLDRKGKLYISWSRDGEVYLEERGGQRINISQSPGVQSLHPVVDAYGDRLSVTWQEESQFGKFDIVQKTRVAGFWEDVQSVFALQNFTSEYPDVVGASQFVWTTNWGNGDFEIYRLGRYEDGWVLESEDLSNTLTVSRFPSATFHQSKWGEADFYCVWAESMPVVHSRLVKAVLSPIPNIPSYFVDTGEENPSPYTIQREGFKRYGSQAYQTADYHSQKLIYKFTGLDKSKKYRLGVTYYFEGEEESEMKLSVDGKKLMKTEIEPKTRVDDSKWIPSSRYKDGEIFVEIEKEDGEFAFVNEISLYEFDRCEDEGAPQDEEILDFSNLPLVYALAQSYPNPFTDETVIKYQLPKEADVSLKVYNCTGQLVKILVQGKEKPGYYNRVWDGKDETGRKVSSGVYFYRFESDGFNKTMKMVVVR